MAIMTPPSTHTPQVGSERARTLWHAANQDFLHEGDFEQLELRSDFVPAVSAGCEVFGATVQISPIELVKRHSKEQYGILTERIYAPARNRVEDRYDAAAPLLLLYDAGVRRKGLASMN